MKTSILRASIVASVLMLPAANCLLADIPTNVDYHIAWTNSAGPWVVITNHYGYTDPIWTDSDKGVLIDNIASIDMKKLVWLEVDYVSQVYFPSDPMILSSELGASISSPTITTNWGMVSLTWEWTIDPQPAWEKITFPDTTYFNLTGINRIDIGTLCIPEPSTMMLVGLGLAGLALKAYRRRSK